MLTAHQKIESLWTLANDQRRETAGGVRMGQALFNALHTVDADLYTKLTATDKDCFYDDKVVDAFLAEVEARWYHQWQTEVGHDTAGSI